MKNSLEGSVPQRRGGSGTASWSLCLRGSTRLHTPVADADAEGHRELLDLPEPRRPHHSHHLLAADERIDRLGKVLVGPGLVAADEGSGAGEDLAEVEVVEAAEDGVGGEGELEDDHPAAGAEDAVKLADRGRRVGDVADAEGDGDDVAAGVGEGEGLGVAVDVGD